MVYLLYAKYASVYTLMFLIFSQMLITPVIKQMNNSISLFHFPLFQRYLQSMASGCRMPPQFPIHSTYNPFLTDYLPTSVFVPFFCLLFPNCLYLTIAPFQPALKVLQNFYDDGASLIFSDFFVF